jgi:predicted secreted hydrolase
MAHLAITDSGGRRFLARERMARGALGMAGATLEPLKVWVERWSAVANTEEGELRWHLQAQDGEAIGVDLELRALGPPIAHGQGGLDRKGPEPGNASYYYSIPRLAARGRVLVNGTESAVAGLAWLDREWSTSALSADVAGWDWFGLQLSDGSSLMFYRLRRRDGTPDRFSAGTFVGSDGELLLLGVGDVDLEPVRYWTSRATGVEYPVAWKVRIPRAGLSLAIEPYLAEQELDLSVRYWEGAVHAEGSARGERVSAQGYLELAGY